MQPSPLIGLAQFAYLRHAFADFFDFPDGMACASSIAVHGIEKRIVYIVRSEADPARHYVGITNDLTARLDWHNHGPSGHTVSHRPWSVVVAIEFRTEGEAVRFEKYLKSGSGRAFAKRHFGSDLRPIGQERVETLTENRNEPFR